MTPLWCEACRQWVPAPPAELFAQKVLGICQRCSAAGWDYDAGLKAVQYVD